MYDLRNKILEAHIPREQGTDIQSFLRYRLAHQIC